MAALGQPRGHARRIAAHTVFLADGAVVLGGDTASLLDSETAPAPVRAYLGAKEAVSD